MKKILIRSIRSSQYIVMAVLFAISTVLASVSVANPASAAIGGSSLYPVPYSQTYPNFVTLGPDNNIWYSGFNFVGKVTPAGVVTQYMNLGYHYGIVKGPDGNIWFSVSSSGSSTNVVSMNTSGVIVSQYTLPRQPLNMIVGSDGNFWLTFGGNVQRIGKMTPAGVYTEYAIPFNGGQTGASIPGIAAGPDGNIWITIKVTGSYNNAIGKMTTSGVLTTYPISTYAAAPSSITAGPDGNMWFTEGVDKIGKVSMTGTITEYATASGTQPNSITTGPDGNLWFTTKGSNKIDRITTSGAITEFVIPGIVANTLGEIVAGSDGAVWFGTNGHNKVGKLVTILYPQTISFTSSAPTGTTIDSPSYAPLASATSGLPVTITIDSSSTGVCSIDGSGVVTYQSVGICTINANQTGDIDYAAAPQAQQVIQVLPVNADSSVSLSCPASVHVGDTVTCAITLSNAGPAASQNATLTGLFPSSLTGASISNGTLTAQNISWYNASLTSGASIAITFNATASVAGKARVSASLLQTSPDPVSSNNIADAIILVL